MTKSRKWLALMLGILIAADILGPKLHVSLRIQTELTLSAFVFPVAIFGSRRFWRTKWFWVTIIAVLAFHILALRLVFHVLFPVLMLSSVIVGLVGFIELWMIDRCLTIMDARYGHIVQTRREPFPSVTSQH